MRQMTSRFSSSFAPARVIFEAATDSTDRLRYVATEDIAPLVQARREIAPLKRVFPYLDRYKFGLRGMSLSVCFSA